MQATEIDLFMMDQALAAAQRALSEGEFPVGCILACGREILAVAGRTGSQGDRPNEIEHAEIRALQTLAAAPAPPETGAITLYSTLEPCLMCFGAILISGITRMVYAFEDAMGGGTACDLSRLPPLYATARPLILPHVRRAESLKLFKAFFSKPTNRYWAESHLARYTLMQ